MKMNDLDELHHFVNDLYERWDEGEISYLQARADARFYCHKFVFKTLREEHLKFAEGKYKITGVDEKGIPVFNSTEKGGGV